MDLQAYRAKKGLSQAEFAALLVDPPATQGMVSHWETGRKTITPERALQIERATNGEVGKSGLRPDLWPPGAAEPVRIDTPEATAAAVPGARAEPPEPAGETPPEEPDPDEGRIGPAEEAA